MALHNYQNQNAFPVGIQVRPLGNGSILEFVVPPSGIVVLENDAHRTRCFNVNTRAIVPLNTMTDLGVATVALAGADDQTTWPP